jgi:hypothetical protein
LRYPAIDVGIDARDPITRERFDPNSLASTGKSKHHDRIRLMFVDERGKLLIDRGVASRQNVGDEPQRSRSGAAQAREAGDQLLRRVGWCT